MLNENELPLNERKGCLGVVYLRAVAAVAGYGVSVPESDYDSVDLIISSKQGKRQRLEFQVKCTAQEVENGPDFGFRLPIKNYDDLRIDTIAPRYLMVLSVPENPDDWLRQNERRMHLRRCGYWLSLKGAEHASNTSDVTVRVPRSNVVTPAALQLLMARGLSR